MGRGEVVTRAFGGFFGGGKDDKVSEKRKALQRVCASLAIAQSELSDDHNQNLADY